jgi:hypothetical protein
MSHWFELAKQQTELAATRGQALLAQVPTDTPRPANVQLSQTLCLPRPELPPAECLRLPACCWVARAVQAAWFHFNEGTLGPAPTSSRQPATRRAAIDTRWAVRFAALISLSMGKVGHPTVPTHCIRPASDGGRTWVLIPC